VARELPLHTALWLAQEQRRQVLAMIDVTQTPWMLRTLESRLQQIEIDITYLTVGIRAEQESRIKGVRVEADDAAS